MKLPLTFTVGTIAATALLFADEPRQAMMLKQVKNPAERGTLSDQRQIVRGDTGKWSDAPELRHAPPPARKPQEISLDDWMDEWADKKPVTTSADENWLLFRTRQLDDNDRVWVEMIERRGNEFILTMQEAVWQGTYSKTFTYYEVNAVNLGRLKPGDYTVKLVVRPLVFKQLEKPREAIKDYRTNWPTDDRPGGGKVVELKTAFSVLPAEREPRCNEGEGGDS